MSSNYVIILAAGHGSRLKSKTPKVMQKIGGLSILDHVIRSAKKIYPHKIIVVSKPNFSVGDLKYANSISIAIQETQNGTGDAVKCALKKINFDDDGWIYVLYGDIPFVSPETLSKLIEVGEQDNKIGVVVLAMASDDSKNLGKLEPAEEPGTIRSIVEAKDADAFYSEFENEQKIIEPEIDVTLQSMIKQNDGVTISDISDVTSDNQAISDINVNQKIIINNGFCNSKYTVTNTDREICLQINDTESYNLNPKVTKKTLIPLCNSGLLIRKDVLKKLINEIKPSKITGELYITEIVKLAYKNGFKCRYLQRSSEELLGVNTCSELAEMEKIFQNHMRKKHMENGVHLVAPETVFFSYDTKIEQSVTIHPYVVFLNNVHIKSGSIIGPFCVIEGAEIQNAQVGPFSRLRTGTTLCEGAKAGNFVEIKNSTISEKSKINHLSYVGDSFVGQNTNIGAGTITCNYDGFTKYNTHIGNNVFIGSNSAIVAPINIGDDAVIGAGSTITKNINNDELAISRNHQINYENGASRFRERTKRKK